MNNLLKKKKIMNIFYFLAGLFIFSGAFTFFLMPHNLVFGGVSGLSIIFKKFSEIRKMKKTRNTI